MHRATCLRWQLQTALRLAQCVKGRGESLACPQYYIIIILQVRKVRKIQEFGLTACWRLAFSLTHPGLDLLLAWLTSQASSNCAILTSHGSDYYYLEYRRLLHHTVACLYSLESGNRHQYSILIHPTTELNRYLDRYDEQWQFGPKAKRTLKLRDSWQIRYRSWFSLS